MPGIYIHFPFCKSKCAYCDFISFPSSGEGDFSRYSGYVGALTGEIQERKSSADSAVFDTVFIGGGTPSLMPENELERLFSEIRSAFRISDCAEITIEANPDSLSREKAEKWLKLGINRLSIGVQSFDDKELSAIGRAHTSRQAKQALISAKEAGFANISADLMCGLPGQTAASLAESIEKAASLGVKHVSCYQLQLEKGTPLEKMAVSGEIAIPGDDETADMMAAAVLSLKKLGYERYEVSNFAIPGFFSRHNMNYWLRGEYIGLGLAAHSFWGGARFANTENLDSYLAGGRAVSSEIVDDDGANIEKVMLSLRTSRGLDERDMTAIQKERAEYLVKRGLLRRERGFFSATDRGFEALNAVILFILEG